MAMSVRPATVDDADRIAAVQIAARQAAYRGVMPSEFLNGLDPSRLAAHWSETVAGQNTDAVAFTMVASIDDRIVAIATVGPNRDGLDGSTGELIQLNADPSAWGSGAATALHSTALSELAEQGSRDAVLWVVDSNARARRFYEREGWAFDHASKTDVIGGADVNEVRYRIKFD